MSFEELIGLDSLIAGMASLSFMGIAVALLLAFTIGIFIFWIYSRTYSGVMYSTSFGVSIVALTMISTMVILAVTSNVVLSLGMVGALSIVRFRTAVKDPMDIVFLFWGITAGIILAAGFITLVVFGSAIMGIMLSIFSNRPSFTNPYILMVIGSNSQIEEAVRSQLNQAVSKMVIKSKTVSSESIELNFEIRLKADNTAFIDKLNDIEGVTSVMLVSYNGDFMG